MSTLKQYIVQRYNTQYGHCMSTCLGEGGGDQRCLWQGAPHEWERVSEGLVGLASWIKALREIVQGCQPTLSLTSQLAAQCTVHPEHRRLFVGVMECNPRHPSRPAYPSQHSATHSAAQCIRIQCTHMQGSVQSLECNPHHAPPAYPDGPRGHRIHTDACIRNEYAMSTQVRN